MVDKYGPEPLPNQKLTTRSKRGDSNLRQLLVKEKKKRKDREGVAILLLSSSTIAGGPEIGDIRSDTTSVM
jgi:hypothetical protein